MAKASSTRRQAPAPVPTPEERAEEDRRCEEARRTRRSAPPAPDPAFAAAAAEVLEFDDPNALLGEGRWLPTTPAEVAGALQWLAGSFESFIDVQRQNDPSLHSLREHVLALESVIVGRDVRYLARLDDDEGIAYELPGRVEFHRLYQRFEQQRKAGEDAGLHQRLTEAEARSARLESRLALLEARMSTSSDWLPGPDDDLAQQFLWLRNRCDGGPYIGMRGPGDPPPATGDVLEDLSSEALRPRTWAQMLDCLQALGQEVGVLVDNADSDPNDLSPRVDVPPATDEQREKLTKVLVAAYERSGVLSDIRARADA
jgi:hypothetical protein